MTLEELAVCAKSERQSLLDSTSDWLSEEVERSIWLQTLEEVKSGILEGPIPLNTIPGDTPLNRRFGVVQGPKIRCVDDFSKSGVNACAQTSESPKPHTLDVVAGLCSKILGCKNSFGEWLGRVFDLKSAYRQCAVHPESYLCLHNSPKP